MNKISEEEKIIQEQAKQTEDKEKQGKKVVAAKENLKESERSQAEMAKMLEETEAASSRVMKKLSENQKTIQEQAQLIKENKQESSAEGRNAKDKEKERARADITQRLEVSEALSTKAMNELSEKEKIIQEQAKQIE